MPTLRFLCLVFAGLALSTGPLQAQTDTTQVIDLASLLTRALADNPSLRAARLQAAAQAEDPAQAGALADPSVMAGYRPLAFGGVSGVVPSQLMVQQMIPFPGKLDLAARAATYGAHAAASEAEALALHLAHQVQDAYYELYRIQQEDRLIEGFLDRLEGFEEAAATRYEVGQGPQQAILKAQVEQLALKRRRLDLGAARRTQIERLARLTDRPDLAARERDLVLAAPAPHLAALPALEEVLARRPEVEALQLRRQQADAEVALARKAFRPDFVVGAGLMDMMRPDEPVRPLMDLADRFTIQAGIVIPLQRGKREAALAQARLRREVLDARLAALQTEIQTEINTLQARLQEDAASLSLYEEALLPQAETAVAATLSAYTTGRADFLDLLDAERVLFDLRISREETLASFLQTRAELDHVLGSHAHGIAASH